MPLMIIIMKFILSLVFLLISVAFFTLVERKMLGLFHIRYGPNKVGFYGVLQPFSDALKLFTKEDVKLKGLIIFTYLLMPIVGIFLMLCMWLVYPFWGVIMYSNFSFIIFFCMSSLSVYFFLLSGWVSGSKFSVFGGYRTSAQAISYEIVLITILLLICIMVDFLNLMVLSKNFHDSLILIILLGLMVCWIMSCLAECNRSPFDFSEGESELVSGFNTEYSGGLFSLIFIGEYSSIIFFSFLTSILFFSGYGFYLVSFLMLFLFLWVRSSFPRLRYDKLMMMSWKGLLMFCMGPFIYVLFF